MSGARELELIVPQRWFTAFRSCGFRVVMSFAEVDKAGDSPRREAQVRAAGRAAGAGCAALGGEQLARWRAARSPALC